MSEYLLPLKSKAMIAESTMAFWFDTRGTDYSFKPGQWADFYLPLPLGDPEGNERTFSFASAPEKTDEFMIAMRMRKSVFKDTLCALPAGTKVSVSRAGGSFLLHEDSSRVAVFLAGGIGITPFRSMLESVMPRQTGHKIFLFYSNNSRGDTAFLDELLKWSSENKNFIFIPTITESFDPLWRHERGRINRDMIHKYIQDLSLPMFYISGPPEMVLQTWQMLSVLGVSDDQIKTEEFSGY